MCLRDPCPNCGANYDACYPECPECGHPDGPGATIKIDLSAQLVTKPVWCTVCQKFHYVEKLISIKEAAAS